MADESTANALSAADARVAIASADGGRVGIVDIRPSEEFGTGHIAGATNFPEAEASSISEDVRDRDGVERWVVVCGDGQASAAVASELAENGMDAAYLEGGMAGWIKEDYPTQPPESDKEYEGPDTKLPY